MMEVILKPGEALEVSFESAEDNFVISSNADAPEFTTIKQTAGWRVTETNIDLEEIILYASRK